MEVRSLRGRVLQRAPVSLLTSRYAIHEFSDVGGRIRAVLQSEVQDCSEERQGVVNNGREEAARLGFAGMKLGYSSKG
jgi:hypothetical protein